MTDNLRGIIFKISAVTIFTVMMAIIKATAGEVPTGQQVFYRAFFSMLVVIGWLAARGDLRTTLRTSNISGHIWRGFRVHWLCRCAFLRLEY